MNIATWSFERRLASGAISRPVNDEGQNLVRGRLERDESVTDAVQSLGNGRNSSVAQQVRVDGERECADALRGLSCHCEVEEVGGRRENVESWSKCNEQVASGREAPNRTECSMGAALVDVELKVRLANAGVLTEETLIEGVRNGARQVARAEASLRVDGARSSFFADVQPVHSRQPRPDKLTRSYKSVDFEDDVVEELRGSMVSPAAWVADQSVVPATVSRPCGSTTRRPRTT